MCPLDNIHLLIDSAKRPYQTEPSNQFYTNISPKIRNVVQVQLESFQIPLSWYNITDLNVQNNSLIIEYATVDYTIEVPPGLYTTPIDLLNALEDQLNTDISAVTWTLTYNENTGRVTISGTDDYKIYYSTGLPKLLGMTETLEGSSSYTFDNACNINGQHQYIKLYMSALASSEIRTIDKENENSCFIIPVPSIHNATFGQILNCTIPQDEQIKILKTEVDLDRLLIAIYTSDNIPLDLHGLDFQCKLALGINEKYLP